MIEHRCHESVQLRENSFVTDYWIARTFLIFTGRICIMWMTWGYGAAADAADADDDDDWWWLVLQLRLAVSGSKCPTQTYLAARRTQQIHFLRVRLHVLTTSSVLESTGIPPRHRVHVAGWLDHGLVDGGSVLFQTSPTTTSPDIPDVVIKSYSNTCLSYLWYNR